MNDNPMQIPYQITQVKQGYSVDATGTLQQVKIVHYKAATGDTGNIEIPVSDFSAELVGSMIEAELQEVAKLRGM